MGRFIKWPRPTNGEVNVTDPYSGLPSNATNAFLNGSMLRWNLDKLDPGKSASLNMEVELLYPTDSGWKERLDTGATAAYEGYSYNHTLENKDDWPVINLTYPTWIYSGERIFPGTWTELPVTPRLTSSVRMEEAADSRSQILCRVAFMT